MRARCILHTLFLALVLQASMVSAEPVLRVALFDIAPYAMASPTGKPIGVYVTIVNELAAASGMQAEISLVPFARLANSLADSSADLTISFPTQALDKVGLRLGNVLTVESLVVTSANKPATRVEQLGQHVIGRARGGCQDLSELAAPRPQLVDVNGFASGVRMLAMGRLDGLCLTREVLDHYAAETGTPRSQLGPEIVVSRRAAVAFVRPQLDAGVRQRLAAAIARRERP